MSKYPYLLEVGSGLRIKRYEYDPGTEAMLPVQMYTSATYLNPVDAYAVESNPYTMGELPNV
jgi:hypothetical protein